MESKEEFCVFGLMYTKTVVWFLNYYMFKLGQT